MHVLYTSIVKAGVEEEKDGETGGQTGREQLHVGGLGQADQVKEVTAAQETELVAEASRVASLVASSHVELSHAGGDLIIFVAQLRSFV